MYSMRMLSVLLLAWTPQLLSAASSSTVVTGNDWGPFVGKDLPNQGVASMIVRETFAAASEQVTVRFRPWNRAYREAREGMHLGIFPYSHNEERAQDFLFTEPLFHTRVRLLAARRHIEPDTRLETIKVPSICLPLGYNTRVAESLFKRSEIILKRPRAMVNCLRMLQFGRVDLVLVSERVAGFLIDNEKGLERVDFFVLSRSYNSSIHLMVSRALPNARELIRTLDSQLEQMKANGRIQSIFERYGIEDYAPER